MNNMKIARKILEIMVYNDGKPWQLNDKNQKAIFAFLFRQESLPYYMKDQGNRFKNLYNHLIGKE